jgi:hypothetical protein
METGGLRVEGMAFDVVNVEELPRFAMVGAGILRGAVVDRSQLGATSRVSCRS